MTCGSLFSFVLHVHLQIIDGAGHHIFADKPDSFNEIVSKICRGADASEKTNQTLAEEKEREAREMLHQFAQWVKVCKQN